MKLERDGSEVHALPNFLGKPNAIPVPATFAQEVSDIIRRGSAGYRYTLRSKHNINPEKGLRDDFDRDAWAALSQNPDSAFTRIVPSGARAALIYAQADLAKQN